MIHSLDNRIIVSFSLGIICGYAFRARTKLLRDVNNLRRKISPETAKRSSKLVLVVRNDLKMGKGKMCSQCSHASVMAYENALTYDPIGAELWKSCGQAKIAVQADSENTLIKLADEAKKAGLAACIVCDSGRTQVSPFTKTVLAIGPGEERKIDKVTGHLKLL